MIRKLLALLALAMPAVLHADWYEAATPHFLVYSNDNAKHLSDYAAELERFDKALRVLHGIPDRPISATERVNIFVVQDTADIASLSTEGVAGFYHSEISGSYGFFSRRAGDGTKWDLDPKSVLRHEYTHHFMFSNYDNGALPLWYVEGFAEFHATALTQPDGAIVFGQAPAYRAAALLAYDNLSVAQMIDADNQRLDLMQVNVLYGKGWALMHYLTFEPTRRSQLAKYVADINSGKTSLQAAAAFGDLNTLNQELSRYVRRSKLTVVTIAPDKLSVAPPVLRKLTAGEAATMSARIQSKAGVTTQTAPAVFAKASKAAEPYPNDPGAQLALAEAAYDAKDYAQSLAAANRAIAADSKLEKAYVYRGKALMGQASAGKSKDVATWDAVRDALLAANRLDNDDPEALTYFYRTYRASGEAPTNNARAALRTALTFAPEDGSLRMEVALDYLGHKQNAQARETLKTLAYSPHARAAAKRARDLIAAIDKNDPAAIDKLTKPAEAAKPKDK